MLTKYNLKDKSKSRVHAMQSLANRGDTAGLLRSEALRACSAATGEK